ncbi:MAG: hypothetical protein ACPLPR_06750 [Bacillota bacterium]
MKACVPSLSQEREQLKRVVGKVLDNLPALRGPVAQLTRTLKATSRAVFEQLVRLAALRGATIA